MLDIQARHHVDARVQQFLHILPALVVPATGHDGMGQLIHQDDLRTAGEHGRQVHLLERRPPVRHLPRRHDLQALRQGAGIRPAVRLSDPDDDITTRGGEPPALSQQGIRLARTRRSPQEQVQPALAPALRYHQPLPARSDPRRLPAIATRPPAQHHRDHLTVHRPRLSLPRRNPKRMLANGVHALASQREAAPAPSRGSSAGAATFSGSYEASGGDRSVDLLRGRGRPVLRQVIDSCTAVCVSDG